MRRKLCSPIQCAVPAGVCTAALKAHGLLERDGKRYAYRLTDKGAKIALLFVLFHKQLCGPLANSLFRHQHPSSPNSKLESAIDSADASLRNIIQLLVAA